MKSTREAAATARNGQDKVDFMMSPPSATPSLDSVGLPATGDSNNIRRLTKRNFCVYIAQLVILSIVIFVSLLNLSVGWNKEHKDMWLALLCSCLGYILPSPSYKRKV